MKRFLKYGFYALVLISLGVAASKYLSGEVFLAALEIFAWRYLPLILSLTLLYVFLKGWRFKVFIDSFVDLSRWALARAYLAGQSATLLPAGAAARVVILEHVGVPLPKGGAAVLFASLTDQAVLIGALLLAALWFEEARVPALIALAVLAVLGVLVGVKATRVRLLKGVQWLAEKLHQEDKWRSFQDVFAEGMTRSVALRGLALTAAAFVLMPVALALCLRALGLTVPLPTLLLAYVLSTVLGRLSSLPGGLGVTEASMVGILSAAPGVDSSQVAAAVAVFRAGTVFFAAALGGVVYLFMQFGGGAEAASKATQAEVSQPEVPQTEGTRS